VGFEDSRVAEPNGLPGFFIGRERGDKTKGVSDLKFIVFSGSTAQGKRAHCWETRNTGGISCGVLPGQTYSWIVNYGREGGGEMAKAKNGDTVKVHYTAKLEDGTVFSSSGSRGPLQFTIGDEKTIPGFEQAVIGMSPGELKKERVPADRAFGPYREELVMEVDRQQIPADVRLEIGKRFQIPNQNGQITHVSVTNVSDSKVTFDANHPLARDDLIFDIELLEIL
jgi:peptidylprolyl isomerase